MSTETATATDQAPKPMPPAANGSSDNGKDAPTQLPEDHPLVRALAAQKDEIKALKA